jgi:ferrochelatase
MKIGVLLINLGTPDDPSRGAVYKYLKQFLLDKRVIDINWLSRNLLVRGIIAPFRSSDSAKLYQQLWTKEGSPLKTYGFALRDGVQAHLGDNYAVELGMRYQNPSIEKAYNALKKQNVSRIIVFPLFPHYASASTGSAHEEVMRIVSKEQVIPDIKFISSYYDHPKMISVFAKNARKYDINEYDHILFSYHGIPQRQMIKADHNNHCLQSKDCCKNLTEKNQYCYSAQCHATTKALVKELNIPEDKYTLCFQSRLGKDPWMQPYTSDVLQERIDAGDKKLLAFSPAFVSDCLETTVEISHEYNEEFKEKGGERIDLVESLNDDPDWISAVADMVKAN